MTPRLRTVLLLGSAQTLAWASSYYLPAVLAVPVARDLGLAVPTVFAAFSVALAISALMGPWAGRRIDRLGGRSLLMASNGVFAFGLVLLAAAQGAWGLFFAWGVIGLAMGAGLYDAAFATLVKLQRADARQAITGITLLAGFASTIGWPMTAWIEAHAGWRAACGVWAAVHLLLALPLNAALPRAATPEPASEPATEATTAPASTAAPVAAAAAGVAPVGGADVRANAPAEADTGADTGADTDTHADTHADTYAHAHADADARADHPAEAPQRGAPAQSPAFVTAVLATVFAITGVSTSALAAHLPSVLEASGASRAAAVAIGALIGPAQVAARVLEFSLLRRWHALRTARVAALGQPLGMLVLLVAGAPWAPLFALLHGAGNGMLTITKGTLPLALFGSAGYGATLGWLMLPARALQALAPFAAGLALARWPTATLWIMAVMGLVAAALLALLRAEPRSRT